MKGCDLFRCDRQVNTRGGGVLLYIKHTQRDRTRCVAALPTWKLYRTDDFDLVDESADDAETIYAISCPFVTISGLANLLPV